MNAGNLAICFGYVVTNSHLTKRMPLSLITTDPLILINRPTLMGANSGGNIADAGWQVRVIETILNNTFQIFDDD